MGPEHAHYRGGSITSCPYKKIVPLLQTFFVVVLYFNVLGGSLLVISIKSFFRYVLTFELNGLTTLCSIRTFTRMAGVYA